MDPTRATPPVSAYPPRESRGAGYVDANSFSNVSSGPTPAQGRPGAGNVSFSQILSIAQQGSASSRIPTNRWRSLSFLNTYAAPQINWPWTQTGLGLVGDIVAAGVNAIAGVVVPQSPSLFNQLAVSQPPQVAPSARMTPLGETGMHTATQPLSLVDYPRPAGDNGRGIHWIPTVSQSPDVVDRLVDEAVAMGMKWVVFLNQGANMDANDYLVKRLTEAGIEPIMRVYTPGLVPIEGDLKAMVSHYTKLGVNYFQLYNEPNLMVETGGRPPDVDDYLDVWIPAAQQVIAGGGLPGFGALSPQGEVDDRDFLRQALQALTARDQTNLLDRAWLAIHNYTGPRPLDDPDGFLRFRQYDGILRAALGRSLPIIGTEGGTHVSEHVSEEQQIDMVTGAYNYMRHPEAYNFAYTYWIIANGHDPAWESQALIHPDGPTALAEALKKMDSGGNI
jgi:hypothetical protein